MPCLNPSSEDCSYPPLVGGLNGRGGPSSYMNNPSHLQPSPQAQEFPNGLTASYLMPPINCQSYLPSTSVQPCLRIIEQPTSTTRFRYKSEKGSHGGLTGERSTSTKKTHPKVKLENYVGDPSKVSIQASLYTHEDVPKRHVHKLNSGKFCNKEGVCTVGLHQEDMTASFIGVGVMFEGKKEVTTVLFERKLKECGLPTISEEIKKQMQEEAEKEGKEMNLNCVTIRFEAYVEENNQKRLICPPVYSHPIYNQKSTEAGELKICRISRSSGSCFGDEEVFLLCEKVNKREIKVRFFELENGEVVWEDYGRFNEGDVHRQCAIVFRTPQYKDVHIQNPVPVFMQLERTKDKRKSNFVQFTYIPDEHDMQYERKRKRTPSREYGGFGSSPSGYEGSYRSGPGPSASGMGGSGGPESQMTGFAGMGAPSNFRSYRESPASETSSNDDPMEILNEFLIMPSGPASELSFQSESTPCTSELSPQSVSEQSSPPHVSDLSLSSEYHPSEENVAASSSQTTLEQEMESWITNPILPSTLQLLDTTSSSTVESWSTNSSSAHSSVQLRSALKSPERDPVLTSVACKQTNADILGYFDELSYFDDLPATQFEYDSAAPARLPKQLIEKMESLTLGSQKPHEFSVAGEEEVTKEKLKDTSKVSIQTSSKQIKEDEKLNNTPKTSSETLSRQIKEKALDPSAKPGHGTLPKSNISSSKPSAKLSSMQETQKPASRQACNLSSVPKHSLKHFASKLAKSLREFIATGDVRYVLSTMRHLIPVQDKDGDNCVHLAVIHQPDKPVITKWLLQALGDVKESVLNCKNNFGQTPLHIASLEGRSELAKLLVSSGANSNTFDRRGNTAIHLAASKGHANVLKELLKKRNYPSSHRYSYPNINLLNFDGLSALHLAVKAGHTQCVNRLCEAGCDVNIPNGTSGRTPLHMSIVYHPEVVPLLLSKPSINVNAQDYGGNTALHIACAEHDEHTITVLMNANANPHVENFDTFDEESDESRPGRTPLEFAGDNEKIKNILAGKSLTLSSLDLTPPKFSSSATVITDRTVLRSTSRDVTTDAIADKSASQDSSEFDSGYISHEIHILDHKTMNKLAELLDPPSTSWKALGMFLGVDEDILKGCSAVTDSPTKYIVEQFEKSHGTIDELLSALQIAGLTESERIVRSANVH